MAVGRRRQKNRTRSAKTSRDRVSHAFYVLETGILASSPPETVEENFSSAV
jgi:hypothetical protein